MLEFLISSLNYAVKFTAFALLADNLFNNKLSKFCVENETINKICTNTVLVTKCAKSVIAKKLFTTKPVKISKNRYLLSYTLNNKEYCIIINKKSGPKKFIQAIDQDNNDITQIISAFAGPASDFHNSKITPNALKYQEITFNLCDGNSVSFKENDVINLVN